MMSQPTIEVRPLLQAELPSALELVERVFMAFEAPEYAPEGIQTFLSFIKNPEAVSALTFFGALENGDLIGVLATRGNSHIALFFVEATSQGHGVGRALFSAAKSACQSDLMTVNSSPYAVEIYRRLGFVPLTGEQVRDGIRFTPMKIVV